VQFSDKAAAVELLRKFIRKQGFAPETITTDKLGSYGAAMRQLRLSARRGQGQSRSNRAENSRQPTRRRERKMQRFKSAGRPSRSCCPMLPSTTPSIPSATLSLAKL
jgi:transposase-like protein